MKLFENRDEQGNYHNVGKPACVSIVDGDIRCCFFKHGLLHRDNNKPAFIDFDRLHNIKIYKYVQNGVYYRENDLPTSEVYVFNMPKSSVNYYKDKYNTKQGDNLKISIWKKGTFGIGRYHRINKPAVKYCVDGKCVYYSYYLNGKCHNPVGPAICDGFGWIHFYIHGKRIEKNKFLERLEKRLKTDNQ
jgi:hypothetical protein